MKKPLFISNAKVSRVIISITKERNKYFVETKEQSKEYFNYNLGEIKWYYDNLEQVEEYLNSVLNNNTYRGPVYNVSIVCNNDIVEICIEYPSNYQYNPLMSESVSDSELKDIIVKIMSKVSSLDIYYNYMVIIQAVYAKNITKIYTYKEGTTMFNSLLYKISPINIKDVEYIKKEILEKLIVSDRFRLPKDKPKTVFIYDGSDYKYIEINSNDIDRVRMMSVGFHIDRGLCYTINSLDDESKESILEDFMKLF